MLFDLSDLTVKRFGATQINSQTNVSVPQDPQRHIDVSYHRWKVLYEFVLV